MKWLKRKAHQIIRFKVYFDRARMYLGYAQFFLILLVFFESYKNTKFGIWFYKYSFITAPAFLIFVIIIAIFIGYLDKQHVRGKEASEIMKQNPLMMDMYSKINDLYKKMTDDK